MEIWVQLFPAPGQWHKKIIKRGINFYTPVKTGKTIKWGFLFFFRGDGKFFGTIKYKGNYPYF